MRQPVTMLLAAVISAALMPRPAPAQPRVRELATMEAAGEVLRQATRIPERGIPARLLCDAAAVAVIPHVVKVGFVLGGERGRGVLLIRCKDGTWSNPIFLTLTGGGVGLQAGVQATDLVLVFKTRRGLDRFLAGKDKLTLGADAAVAAGPIGRDTRAATDALLKAEIYSYSRSRGLFGGVSLDGEVLRIDDRANAWYYGRSDVTPADIVSNNGILIPPGALQLQAMLNTLAGPPAVPAVPVPVAPAPAVPAVPAPVTPAPPPPAVPSPAPPMLYPPGP